MTKKSFVAFGAKIENADQKWSAFSRKLKKISKVRPARRHSKIATAIRNYADRKYSGKADLAIRAFAYVLADLVDQKWSFKCSSDGLNLSRSKKTDDLVRDQLHVRRDASLATPSVKSFLAMMESHKDCSEKKSIRELIHDGTDLAKQIQAVLDENLEITDVIRPSLQLVTAGKKDKITGHYLTDVWRYCRLTWSLEYNPVPGRQMTFLIRNDAQKNKPIMAIGSLASPILQHGIRDDWIGWSYKGILSALAMGKFDYPDIIELMIDAIETAISDLFIDDLNINQNIIDRPSFSDIYRLESICEREKIKRIEMLKSDSADDYRRKVTPKTMTDQEILDRAKTPLFRGKRAGRLAKLLKVKRFINKLQNSKNHYEATQMIFYTSEGKSALRFAVGEIRTVGTSSRVADLNVCGAIPPYNHLIGGKLAALSVFSEEMQKYYRLRYRDAESEIATFMAGRRITRPTNLEVITTTSLFGDKLGQYHGLKIKKARHQELVSDHSWERLGLTIGEGTFQFSNLTNSILREYLKDARGYRQVNNVFGEGTSPKMRNLRTAISSLGFNADEIMKHQQQRLFLVAELNPDAKNRLMKRHLKTATKRSKFRDISNAWIDQWVKNRITKEGILDRIKAENFDRLAKNLKPKSHDN